MEIKTAKQCHSIINRSQVHRFTRSGHRDSFYQEFIVFYGLEITHPMIVNMNNIGVRFDFRWDHRQEKHLGGEVGPPVGLAVGEGVDDALRIPK